MKTFTKIALAVLLIALAVLAYQTLSGPAKPKEGIFNVTTPVGAAAVTVAECEAESDVCFGSGAVAAGRRADRVAYSLISTADSLRYGIEVERDGRGLSSEVAMYAYTVTADFGRDLSEKEATAADAFLLEEILAGRIAG